MGSEHCHIEKEILYSKLWWWKVLVVEMWFGWFGNHILKLKGLGRETRPHGIGNNPDKLFTKTIILKHREAVCTMHGACNKKMSQLFLNLAFTAIKENKLKNISKFIFCQFGAKMYFD